MKRSDWTRIIRYSVFRNLDDNEIGVLLRGSDGTRVRTFREGEVIFKQGDPGDEVYLLGSGAVEVFLPSRNDKRVILNELRKGAVFGEIAVLKDTPRSASVSATKDALVLEIARDCLENILKDHPEIKMELALISSERLRLVGEQALALAQSDVDGKIGRFQDKLDAELQTISAQLAAARTIFDQTSQRASEIITSAERTRRLTLQASSVGAVVVVIGGFFGINEYKDIVGPMKAAKQQTMVLLEDSKQLFRDAERDFRMLHASTQYMTTAFWLPKFEEAILEDQKEAYKAFKVIVSSEEPDATQKLLFIVLRGLIDGHRATTPVGVKKNREAYHSLLAKIVDDKVAQTDLHITLSYALLLTSLSLLIHDEFPDLDEGFKADFRRYELRYKQLVELYGDALRGGGTDFLDVIEVFKPQAVEDAQAASPPLITLEQFDALEKIWKLIPA